MITDPIADFITQIQNAGRAGKTEVSLPFSQMKLSIAEALKKEGYISSIEKKGRKVKKTLSVELAADNDGVSKIKGVKRISKPSRRVYIGADEIRPIKYGHGIVILSTPKGILSGKQARKERVGGEVLFEIW